MFYVEGHIYETKTFEDDEHVYIKCTEDNCKYAMCTDLYSTKCWPHTLGFDGKNLTNEQLRTLGYALEEIWWADALANRL